MEFFYIAIKGILSFIIMVAFGAISLYSVRVMIASRMAEHGLDNAGMASAVRRAGVLTGAFIAGVGAGMNVFMPPQGVEAFNIASMTEALTDLLFVTLFVMISTRINDNLVFHHVDNDRAIAHSGFGIGMIEGAMALATGLVAAASVYGEGPWWSSILYFVVSQGFLMVGIKALLKLHDLNQTDLADGKHVEQSIEVGLWTIGFGAMIAVSAAGDTSSSVFYAPKAQLILGEKWAQTVFYATVYDVGLVIFLFVFQALMAAMAYALLSMLFRKKGERLFYKRHEADCVGESALTVARYAMIVMSAAFGLMVGAAIRFS